uniref:Uncharacterized protein n=1 Tax=Trichuris muris TaxID=70415 RepID=A0A5S6QE09_TRIMR
MKIIVSAKWIAFLEDLLKANSKPVILYALGFEAPEAFFVGYFAQCSDQCTSDSEFQEGKDELTGINSSALGIGGYNRQQEPSEGSAARANGPELPDENSLYSRARQLLRLLPGGIDICGIMLVSCGVETTAWESSAIRVAKRLRKLRDRHVMLKNDASLLTKHLFIATVCDSLENFNSQLISFVNKDVQAHPGPALAVQDILWCSLQTKVAVNVSSSCGGSVFGVDFLRRFVDLVDPYGQRFLNSHVLVDGRLPSDHKSIYLSNLMHRENGLVVPLQAKFLLSSSDERMIAELEYNDVTCARMRLTGVLAIRAFVPSVCTIEEGVTALRKDVLRTLYIRGELHYEERLVTGAENEANSYRGLPRRVFASLGSPGECFDVCEYIMHDEDLSFLQNEVGDFFRADMDPSNVELNAEPLMTVQEDVFPSSPQSVNTFSLCERIFGYNVSYLIQGTLSLCDEVSPKTFRILALAFVPLILFWLFGLLRMPKY